MISIRPILDEDLSEACAFMQREINQAIPLADWVAAFRRPWMRGKPNNGFMIVHDEAVVGVLGAIYASVEIAGAPRRLCNLTSLSVMPRYRARTMDLLANCMAQKGFEITNFTPNSAVEKICRLLKFREMDAGQYLIPVTPGWPGRLRLLPTEEAAAALGGGARQAYQDHAGIGWVERLVFEADGAACLVAFKRRSITRLRAPMAEVLHISDPAFFLRHLPAIGVRMALAGGYVASLVDRRLLPDRPRPAMPRTNPQVRLFHGELADRDIPLLYSELAALPL
jgi:acetoacetyl-CoA synthetase